jgi:hypothetical protein
MKGSVMENKSFGALSMVLIILAVAFAFYWYEYRPSQIRAECEKFATDQAADFLKQIIGKKASKDLPEGMYFQANKEVFYLSCVRENGLER